MPISWQITCTDESWKNFRFINCIKRIEERRSTTNCWVSRRGVFQIDKAKEDRVTKEDLSKVESSTKGQIDDLRTVSDDQNASIDAVRSESIVLVYVQCTVVLSLLIYLIRRSLRRIRRILRRCLYMPASTCCSTSLNFFFSFIM